MIPEHLSPGPDLGPLRFQAGETDVLIRHNGTDLLGVDLRNMVVEHEAGRVPYAVLLFNPGTVDRHNVGVQGDPEAVVGRFQPGDTLELFAVLRGKGRKAKLFHGEVTKLKLSAVASGLSYRVEARARCHRMTMRRRTEAHADKSETDMMEALLQRHGVQGNIEWRLSWTTTTVQHNATDWDFLLSRAEANGMVVFPQLDQVKVTSLQEPSAAELQLVLGQNILEFESELDAGVQYAQVEAWGWNDQSRGFEEVEVDTQSRTAMPQAGNLELNHGGGRPYDELYMWSQGTTRRLNLAETKSSVKVHGTEVWPGAGIQLQGLGAQLDGIKLLSGVRHEIGYSGWVTHLQLGLSARPFLEQHGEAQAVPATGLLPGVNGLQIGIVRGLEGDPDGGHRIEISLVSAGDNAGRIWARWATLQAGNGSGSFFLPDVDDEVVVGFLNGDPRDAVVLGSLYSKAYAPPFEMSDSNPERGIQSPKKSKIIIDEQVEAVEISTGDTRNYIYIQAGDAPGIDIVDQFDNRISLSDRGIEMRSQKDISISTTANIELRANDIKLQANAQAKVSGMGGAELSSPANTVVKGALVQIN